MAGMIEEAFQGIFHEKEFNYSAKIKYSGRFKGYNANIRLNRFTKYIVFSLSRNWRSVDRNIKIGLLQELMCRMFKKTVKTTNIDLYHIFLKQAHLAVPKTKTHPVLEESFNRVNGRFFAGMMDLPNLVVSEGLRALGHYDYGTDTVSITKHVLGHQDCLDYVMYHELLHKKHKFRTKNGRSYHHTSEFRKKEKEFPGADEIEKKLSRILSKRKLSGFFGFLGLFS
ncbi:hypothetical protein GF343_03865 [Candidatus Woesearchaeota archaeon]|nr:hypothetical protein [Candidatus Woesearchaeota archaeon]